MTSLHIFDMDGTLLHGTSASLQIARHLGSTEELVELEARFAAGEIDTRGFAAAIHALWRDLTLSSVADAFAAGPWLTGIRDVCADIRERRERSMVNADHHLAELATLSYRGNDLAEAYALGRTLLTHGTS